MGKLGDKSRQAGVWIIVALGVLVLVVVVQNFESLLIRFLFWRAQVSLSLALIAVGGAGMVIGFLWGARKARPKQ